MNRCGLGLVLLSVWGSPALAQGIKMDLLIDPRQLHLDDPKVRDIFLKYPFERIFIYGFVGGECIFPSEQTIFPRMSHYKDKADVFGDTVRKLKKSGKKVYWAMDCLHWVDEFAIKEHC